MVSLNSHLVPFLQHMLILVGFTATTTLCGMAKNVCLSGLSLSRLACALVTRISCIKDRLGSAGYLGIHAWEV
jgi:hypothetical protein